MPSRHTQLENIAVKTTERVVDSIDQKASKPSGWPLKIDRVYSSREATQLPETGKRTRCFAIVSSEWQLQRVPRLNKTAE